MKQFMITIPDQEESSFIKLMKSISYISRIEETTVLSIPEEHKQLVQERIEKYKNNPENYLTTDNLEDKLNLD